MLMLNDMHTRRVRGAELVNVVETRAMELLLNSTTRLATRTGTTSAFGAQPKGFSPGTVAPARMLSVPQP